MQNFTHIINHTNFTSSDNCFFSVMAHRIEQNIIDFLFNWHIDITRVWGQPINWPAVSLRHICLVTMVAFYRLVYG